MTKNLTDWDGTQQFKDQHVEVALEGGFGDMIMFARYLPALKRACKRVTVECPKALHRLVTLLGVDVYDASLGMPPVEADYITSALEVPFLFKSEVSQNSAYLAVEPLDLPEFTGTFKVGVAWEADPDGYDRDEKSIPLSFFKALQGLPNVKLFTLSPAVHDGLLIDTEDLELYGSPCEDFHDAARLVAAMDVVVTADNMFAHLSAALGKKTFCVVPKNYAVRWDAKEWYKALTLVPQQYEGDWHLPFQIVRSKIGSLVGYSAKVERQPPQPVEVLFTGGCAEVVALESHMEDDYLARVRTAYYATDGLANELYRTIPEFGHIRRATVFPNERTCFASKDEVTRALRSQEEPPGQCPEGWRDVLEWSGRNRLHHIEKGRHLYRGSRLLKYKLATSLPDLPERYVVVHPTATKEPGRSLDRKDFTNLFALLESLDCYAVIVDGPDAAPAPLHPRLVDLIGQTTPAQTVEILKGAIGYVGTDSWVGVLAAQLFPTTALQVKASNPKALEHKAVYFAPHRTFDFVVDSVKPHFPE